jgi:hypothetical protein
MLGYANFSGIEHITKSVPSTKCEKSIDKKSLQTYLLWFDNL